MTTLVFTDTLIPAQDKAFKKEAIESATKNIPPRWALRQWLDAYMLPPKTPVAPPQRYYERRRAELIARKERADALMDLRDRALKNRARRWPRIYEEHEKHDKENRQQTKRCRLEMEHARHAAAAESARKQRRADADARVAYLMELRNRSRQGVRK
ncbi:hypothetical protein C8R43DRAFT_957217 [Mycena crocata]|nr:hypothetical protein C8R43DRAFT_957217 [Mycena crocata]